MAPRLKRLLRPAVLGSGPCEVARTRARPRRPHHPLLFSQRVIKAIRRAPHARSGRCARPVHMCIYGAASTPHRVKIGRMLSRRWAPPAAPACAPPPRLRACTARRIQPRPRPPRRVSHNSPLPYPPHTSVPATHHLVPSRTLWLLGVFVLLRGSSPAAGAPTCTQYCASQAGADDCQSGGDAVLLSTCVCDWVYRGSSRGCQQDFGGFICDAKQVPRAPHPRTPPHTPAHRAHGPMPPPPSVLPGLRDQRGVHSVPSVDAGGACLPQREQRAPYRQQRRG